MNLFSVTGFLTATAENLFKVVLEMQPKDSGEVKGSGSSREEKLRGIIEDILDKLPEEFNTTDLMSKVEDRTPFVIVAFQECERMNILCDELRRSLKELELGLKVIYLIYYLLAFFLNKIFL